VYGRGPEKLHEAGAQREISRFPGGPVRHWLGLFFIQSPGLFYRVKLSVLNFDRAWTNRRCLTNVLIPCSVAKTRVTQSKEAAWGRKSGPNFALLIPVRIKKGWGKCRSESGFCARPCRERNVHFWRGAARQSMRLEMVKKHNSTL